MAERSVTWQNLLVEDGFTPTRFDQALTKLVPHLSRSKAQKLIEQGLALRNDKPVGSADVIRSGDRISYSLDGVESKKSVGPVATDMALDIIYEDDDLLVVNKPAGLVVHGGPTVQGPTLVDALLAHTARLSGLQELADEEFDRPGIVHRIDKDTTGALVIAKDDWIHAKLQEQFQQKLNLRQYICLMDGSFPEGEWQRESYLRRDARDRTRFQSVESDDYAAMTERLGHDPGYRHAKSVFKVEKNYKKCLSLVSVRLYTGRTHQIRIHARDLGRPIIGDQIYGRTPSFLEKSPFSPSLTGQLKHARRQLLHAWVLSFEHPRTGETKTYQAELPADFAGILDQLNSEDV
jgi:23S rRNA pseudouridine1911/1915/1917 synthase